MIRYLAWIGLLAFLAAAPSVAEQKKGWCGILGNKSVVIRNDFLFYPPEREGDSWSAGSSHAMPTECDQKLKSIALEFYYPTMEAAGSRNPYDDPDPRHVQLALSTLPAGYSHAMLSTRLARYVPGYKTHESTHKNYDLFAFRGLDPLYGKSESETLWKADNEGKTELIVVCKRVDKEALSTCKLNYIRHDIPAELNIKFGYNMLSEWPAIMAQTNLLIDSLHK